jgi:hypothetical protein
MLSAGTTEIAQAARRGREDLDRALTQAVQERILPAVRTEINNKLQSAGITPQLISDVKQILNAAKAAGLIR